MTRSANSTVRLSPPPPAVMRVINPVVRRVLTSRILGRSINKIVILQFAGRRTGRTHRIPVILHLIDGAPTVFTSRTWRLNFDGSTHVTVIHRSHPRRGRGVLLNTTPEALGNALRQALDNGATPFDLGLRIARSARPTVADLGSVTLSMIQFELEDPPGA